MKFPKTKSKWLRTLVSLPQIQQCSNACFSLSTHSKLISTSTINSHRWWQFTTYFGLYDHDLSTTTFLALYTQPLISPFSKDQVHWKWTTGRVRDPWNLPVIRQSQNWLSVCDSLSLGVLALSKTNLFDFRIYIFQSQNTHNFVWLL